MTTKEALRIIKAFQTWRRGETEATMDELKLTPKLIGEAIDVACELLATTKKRKGRKPQ